MSLAPIALFAYNRPHHFQKTLDSLAANTLAKESTLHIFCDNGADKEQSNIQRVRTIANNVTGFKSVHCHHSPSNKGLSKSIIEGVGEIVNDAGSIIVLEDDLETSPLFLEYMNNGLQQFQSDDTVGAIQGFIFQLKNAPEAFKLNWFSSWGWATWKSTWNSINFDGQDLLNQLEEKKLINHFDINGSKSFSRMLKNQILGKNDSWAIRMYASLLLTGQASIYPQHSYVQHIGFDSGTHHNSFIQSQDALNGKIEATKIVDLSNVSHIENIEMHKELAMFYKNNTPSLFRKLEMKIAEFLAKGFRSKVKH